ncbi:CvpA family protein [Lachnospiraceae bacterium 48-42]|nr:CvpA family protein [Dorea sp.]
MNWVLMVTGGIVLIGLLIGVYRGAIRIAVSLLASLLTLILVTVLTPYVADAVMKYTPLEDVIQGMVAKAVTDTATSAVADEDGSGLTEEGVRHVLEGAGVTEDRLKEFGISIEDIVNGKVTGDKLADYGISSSLLDGLKNKEEVRDAVENAEIPRDMQVAAIENADIPEAFKELLSENNNNEIYKELGAETFVQYVGKFLSKLVIRIVSFLCTLILVTIIARAVIFALDIVSDLPGLGFLNRIAGGAVGILCALFIVWFFFAIVTLIYMMPVGKEIYELIQDNEFTKLLYEYNPIMKLAMKL